MYKLCAYYYHVPVSVQAYICINLNIAYNWAKKQTNSRKVDSVWLLEKNQLI